MSFSKTFSVIALLIVLACSASLSQANGLTDIIDILQLLTGKDMELATFPTALDFNRDQRINLADLLLSLRISSKLKQPEIVSGEYSLLAWNDLGMHCIDGNDYSVFSILPPYNNLHAQLIKKDSGLQNTGIRITFEATPNLNGTWNTSSADKTNFWNYAETLYGFMYGGGNLSADKGITGTFVQSRLPQDLTLDSSNNWWSAEGIPTLPYNDDGTKNYYQLVKVKAHDMNGTLLAQTTAVLPISDEMDCRKCHSSQSGYQAAQPTSGWTSDANLERDYKLNIIRLHDEKAGTKLYAQVMAGTPILCAKCHQSNALPGSGRSDIAPLTAAIHSRHAKVLDPDTNQSLDSAHNRFACYSCHPGKKTKCLRGAMGGINTISCQDCHGNMSAVGNSNRQGWLDEPTCQQCHQNGNRYSSAFVASGRLRRVTDLRFATNINAPIQGKKLFRFSIGHYGVQCEGCHGATHAVYPSIDPEDNILAIDIQGHAGTIAECTSCHSVSPKTIDGGPHGLHTVGQRWVNAHGDIAEHQGTTNCQACHGISLRGTPLSKTFSARSFSTEWGQKTFSAGHAISCYDCHNGPNDD